MRLNKIEGLKPLLPNRKYGQKWEDLEYGISARSLIERSDAPLAGYLKISTGYWRRMEEAESARQAQIESMQKATEELQMKNAKQREIRKFRQRNNLNVGTGYRNFIIMALGRPHPCLGWLFLSGQEYRICFNKLIAIRD